MNLFPKQKETQRHGKQSYGHPKGKGDGVSHSVMSDSLRPHVLESARFLCPWNSPGKNTRVGCHSFFQGNLPNPGIKLGSPVFQEDSLLSEPPGKER